jgi:hypothetical protein
MVRELFEWIAPAGGTRGDAPGCMSGGNRQDVVEEPKQGGKKQFRRFG